MINDLRYAVRILLKSLSFTAVAVVTLGLGIGANTAIFSMLEAIEGKALRVKDPEQLVRVVPDEIGRGLGTCHLEPHAFLKRSQIPRGSGSF